MTIVSASDFRKNMSHYLELSKTERVIITHRKGTSFEIVPEGAIVDDGIYFSNPAVIAQLKEAENEVQEGRGVAMSSTEFGEMFGL